MRLGIWNSILEELKPSEGRWSMTWRTAAVCSLAAMVFMTYEVPLAAIGCYLVMFLARPTAQENILVAVGISILVSLVVVLLLVLTRISIEVPMWRMIIIVLGSFLFLYIGAASLLGPAGNIVALVIGFVMTLLPYSPVGEIATRGILFAWLMVLIPMGLMVVFHTFAGRSSVRVLHACLTMRLRLIAQSLQDHQTHEKNNIDMRCGHDPAILEMLRKGQSETQTLLKLIRLFHLVPRSHSNALCAAALNTQDLLLELVDVQTRDLLRRVYPTLAETLARKCLDIAELLERNQRLEAIQRASEDQNRVATDALKPSSDSIDRTAHHLTVKIDRLFCEIKATKDVHPKHLAADERRTVASHKADQKNAQQTFFKPDAWSNPDYSRFAIKTTAAAVLAYIIYTSIQWQGIHTAMITCYVAALGTTGETVYKLALRIVGCLIGATMGIASLAFLVPAMTSIGQLMLLVFAGILVAAWVSSGSERISYAGIQIGLAFLMTVLQDFRPDVQFSIATDRIYGILLGNTLLFLMFTQLWPVSVIKSARRDMRQSMATLKKLTHKNIDSITHKQRLKLAIQCLVQLEQARETLRYNRFEPSKLRAHAGEMRSLHQRIDRLESMSLVLARAKQ